MKRLIALMLFSGCFIVSCTSAPTPGPEDSVNASPSKSEEYTEEELKEFSLEGKIRKGMLKSMVKNAWGRPEKSMERQSRDGITATWLYSSRGATLYFEDGLLSSWEIEKAKYDPFNF